MVQKVLLISYDLGIPESSSDYMKIAEYIESFESWAKPLKSQWFIVTQKSTSTVRDELKDICDFNDKILIIDASSDNWATSNISSKVTDWMKQHL